MSAPTRAAHADEAFTLIELLIVIAIGVALLSVASAALIFGVGTTTATADSIDDSARTQVASSWFLTDVQSAQDTSTDGACNASSGSDLLHSFGFWITDDPEAEEDDLDPAAVADWYAPDDAPDEVWRVQCDGDGSTTIAPHPVLTRVDSASIDCIDDGCTLTWTTQDSTAGAREVYVTRRVVAP